MCIRDRYSTVLSYKDTYRPILSGIWLIILLIYIQRLKAIMSEEMGALTPEQYTEATWDLFAQFEAFWSKFA